MTAVARELRLPAALLVGLNEHELRYEIIEGQISLEADPLYDAWIFELLDDLEIRHELLDGLLLVTPPPTPAHEFAVAELVFQLRSQTPPGIHAFGSNLGFCYEESFYALPDVAVVSEDALDQRGMRAAPILVVEVLSPTTRLTDRLLKAELYARHGVVSYWLVDTDERSVTALSLREGEYVETARVVESGSVVLAEPLPIAIDVAALWLTRP